MRRSEAPIPGLFGLRGTSKPRRRAFVPAGVFLRKRLRTRADGDSAADRRLAKIVVSVGLLLAAIAGSARATLYEKGGASGLGARAMGMAGAYSAVTADESAMGWNPAGLGGVDGLRLNSSFDSIYDGRMRAASVAAAYPLPSGAAAGFLWQHAFYSQAVEVNTDVLGFGASLPLMPDRSLRLGGALRVLFGGVRAEGGDFQGLGLDLGLRYRVPARLFLEGDALELGLCVRDLDTRLEWSNGQTELVPRSASFGAAYRLDPSTTAAMDFEWIHAGGTESRETRMLRLGAERWFRDLLALRAGFLLDNHRLHAFSGGMGVKYAGWELEYALVGPVENLGLSHRLSLIYGWQAPQTIRPAKLADIAPQPTPQPTPSAYALALTARPPLFSPNGDGVADTTVFELRLLAGDRDRIAAWRLSIEDGQGNIVRYYDSAGYPETLGWDGRDQHEQMCADGVYVARLLLADAAERRLAHAETTVTLQTRLPHIPLRAEPEKLVIIGPRPESEMNFLPQGAAGFSGLTWRLDVRDASGKVRRTFAGEGELPDTIVWNGLSDGQRPVPAGTYEAVLQVNDAVGNRSTDALPFTVTQLAIGIDHTVTPKIFKPGDPQEGQVTFRLNVSPAGKVATWQLVIRDAESGRTVRTFSGGGTPPAAVTWDGRNAAGETVDGGMYFLSQLKVVFGNKHTVAGPVRPLASDVRAQDSGKALALHLTAVAFESGSSAIPLDAFKNLQQAADTIMKYAKRYRVHIKGYTDGREAPENELQLSRQRARRVQEYFAVSGKIPAVRLEAVGYGSANPLAPDTTPSGRAKNRRVEVVLIIEK